MSVTVSKPFLLSPAGSTRATAYQMTNKAVRIGETTHVTWLDAVSGIRVRSFDHTTSTWGETVELDEGCDNHGNPSLTASPDGKLRVAYGPHGFWNPREGERAWNDGRFRLQESVRPNDASEWQVVSGPGYGATYACLVTDSQDRDHIVYRGGNAPPGCFYERRSPGINLDLTTKLSVQHIAPGYTFVAANLVVAPGDVLYAGFMYYNMEFNASAGVCVLKSPDGGVTWTGVDDRPVTLPLAFDPDYAAPSRGELVYLASLSVDADGSVLALTYGRVDGLVTPIFSAFRDGAWQSTEINPFLPDGWQVGHACMTVDARGRILVAIDARPVRLAAEEAWGHSVTEAFVLASEDGGATFECVPVSPPCDEKANWLANISRVGPNHDMRSPLFLYTHGNKGDGCAPDETTDVYAAWIE